MWVGIVVGRGLSGLAARYVDHHVLIFATMGASAVTGMLVVVAGSIPLAFAALAVTGILIGGSFPTALAIGVRGQPAMVGALTGFIVAGAGLAGGIFPPLTGLIVEGLGFKAAMLLPALLALPAAAAAVVAYYVQRRGRSRDFEAA
jgi:fucose permease